MNRDGTLGYSYKLQLEATWCCLNGNILFKLIKIFLPITQYGAIEAFKSRDRYQYIEEMRPSYC
ncbi:hypothetical protein [Metabacillus fastidiosus]|uniref:hypothetical protein n=1 Tax=Metabacillus fastidiosus TaxID=1458 RepID=UPI000825F231